VSAERRIVLNPFLVLGVSPDSVSVKAKTGEGVDAVGEGRAVAAQAAALLVQKRKADE